MKQFLLWLLVLIISTLALFVLRPKLQVPTAEVAVRLVKEFPEVADYLQNYPGNIVDAEGRDPDTGDWLVHVYAVIEDDPDAGLPTDQAGHTATFNWYHVNPQTGQISKEF